MTKSSPRRNTATVETREHPPGASLHLGGDAWASPDLEPLLVPIGDALPFPGNPRRHDQDNITASIRDHGLYQGIVGQAATGHTMVGNGRLAALRELGATRVPRTLLDVPDDRARAIVARDNQTSDASTNDDAALLALLAPLESDAALLALSGYGTDDLALLRAAGEPGIYTPPVDAPSLADRFVVPPFTVLDQRAGAWQERKRRWLALGIQSEVGRGGTVEGQVSEKWNRDPKPGLGAVQTNLDGVDAARYGRKDTRSATGKKASLDAIRTLGQGLQAHRDPATGELVYTETTAAGVSIFDPVLTELSYRWFSPADGHVLDPFAGGSVRGIIAGALGRTYTGVELRAEQVDANKAQQTILDRIPGAAPVEWVQGDSREVLPTLDVAADLVFSCPPYADLEVYSDDPADLSNMPYDDFLAAYRAIIAAAIDRLRPDRFAVWVVGEVRDRRGIYRGFVPDTIRAFTDAGAALYNEAILVTPVGSLPIRAGRQFSAGRKLGKTHQNVLVFCKGDPRVAAEACGTVEVSMPEAPDPEAE